MKDCVDRIQSGALRMSRLFEDLVQFSRVTIQKHTHAAVNLGPVLAEALSDLDARIRDTRAKVEHDKMPVVFADRMQMYVLLYNLVSNALKFSASSKPPRIRVQSRALKPGWVEISVEDNGIGFDERHLEKIFKPFERLHSREEYEGSGMGLAICQKISANHGGGISARSTPGKGATFFIQLPTQEHP
jgi:signal transduction histidine kinase